MRANARAWAEYAGVPLRAVVKAGGYGWSSERIVRACGGVAQAYCVADTEELQELRRHSQAPAVLLGSVPSTQLRAVLELNALPSISTPQELQIVAAFADARAQPPRVRLGVRSAAAWSGLSLAQLRGFAPALAAASAQVELWTHITDVAALEEQHQTFAEALRVMREAGVAICGTDLASTIPLARAGAMGGSTVRVGVGLFGATGGSPVPGVSCALRVCAPVIRTEELAPGTRVGYGSDTLDSAATVVIARCGYADGLPAAAAGSDGIISVGMQYVTAGTARFDSKNSRLTILDASSDLDAFAAGCRRLPHEIVTAFGKMSV